VALAAALTLLLSTPALVAAQSLPPPPEAPEWIEPVLLTPRLGVTTRTCDEGEPDAEGWTTSWSSQGELRLLGFVHHNGSEQVDRKAVAAWQVGDRLVVAYEVTRDSFTESPTMACGAWTRVEIVFPKLATRPTRLSIYPRTLVDGPQENLPLPR